MKLKTIFILFFISIILSPTATLANSRSYTITVIIPEIIGVNTPPFEKDTKLTNSYQEIVKTKNVNISEEFVLRGHTKYLLKTIVVK